MNELEQRITRLKGNYPVADEALQWYAGLHCPSCKTIVQHRQHGFDNGWDSAVAVILDFLKK